MSARRLLAAALALAGAAQLHAQQFPVQAGVAVRPDTVKIGDPFTVTVAVRAPRGATVDFPAAPDSSAKVQALDPRTLSEGPRTDSATVEQQAVYRVAAWDLGDQRVLDGDIVVHLGTAERRISLRQYTVFVASVLPADSAQRVPKPARALFEGWAIPWWVWLLLALAIALAWWLWYWWRHRQPKEHRSMIDPYARAVAEFTRVDALGLIDAGERGRHVALMVEVLRGYLAARFPTAPLSTTTTELLEATRYQATVLHERLLRTLNEADLIKFAKRPVSGERAREMAKEARALVEHEHKAMEAARAAAAAAEAARLKGAKEKAA